MAGGRCHRHAGGSTAAQAQGDGIGAAVSGNRGADGIGHWRLDTDHQGVRLRTRHAVGIGGRDSQVRRAAGSRRAANRAGASIEAQACRQGAGGDGEAIRCGAASGTDGGSVRRARRAIAQRGRRQDQGGCADGNRHRRCAGGTTGVRRCIGKTVSARVASRRRVGDGRAAGCRRAMAGGRCHRHAGGCAAAEAQGDGIGAAVGRHRGADCIGQRRRRRWWCICITVGQRGCST